MCALEIRFPFKCRASRDTKLVRGSRSDRLVNWLYSRVNEVRVFDSSGEDMNWNAFDDAVRDDKTLNFGARKQICSHGTKSSSTSKSFMFLKASTAFSISSGSNSRRFPLNLC